MKTNSKTLRIVVIGVLLVTFVCVAAILNVRYDRVGQSVFQDTTVDASSNTDENQKIREAIAENFLESIHDNQPEGESDYEPLTLPPDGETFSFDLNN